VHHTTGIALSAPDRKCERLGVGYTFREEEQTMEDNGKISYFFLGLGLGVAAGLLFAPQSGTETRELLTSKADEGKEYLKRRSEELKDSASELVDKGRDLVTRQRDQLNAAVEAGKQAYREAVAGPERNVMNEGV
jgi:gas vesicle protein